MINLSNVIFYFPYHQQITSPVLEQQIQLVLGETKFKKLILNYTKKLPSIVQEPATEVFTPLITKVLTT